MIFIIYIGAMGKFMLSKEPMGLLEDGRTLRVLHHILKNGLSQFLFKIAKELEDDQRLDHSPHLPRIHRSEIAAVE
ncbi:hypothetical protein SAMN05216404_11368 [Nitrosospira multiformis]|uniref:Uncharacterized protein n=1 Tax=Nitrosospira multiformis TaxID=1231 RepID=A0A1H8MPT6_9PROT|nr:hypothetical protein SAMN05216404_11368 [Nitrosospira multiformis]